MAMNNTYRLFPNMNTGADAQMPTPTSSPPLQYFISRTNNALVPLIPADELPRSVRLRGVPRAMSFDQTCGMQYLGNISSTGLFELEIDLAAPRSDHWPLAVDTSPPHILSGEARARPLAPPAHIHQPIAPPHANRQDPLAFHPRYSPSARKAATYWSHCGVPAPASRDPVGQGPPVIDAGLASQSGAATAANVGYQQAPGNVARSGRNPNRDKKEWCTHWIRTGECDYMQQGCLYKHEMPDLPTLNRILGLTRVPKWWQERNRRLETGGGAGAAGKMATTTTATTTTTRPHVPLRAWFKPKAVLTAANAARGDASDESEGETPDADGSGRLNFARFNAARAKLRAKDVPEDAAMQAEPKPSLGGIAAPSTEDLIHFDPLLPTPPPSSPSLAGTSSAEGSPCARVHSPSGGPSVGRRPNTPARLGHFGTPSPASGPEIHTDVFVPSGEPAEHHVADARKRIASKHARIHRSTGILTREGACGGRHSEDPAEKGRSGHSGSGGYSAECHLRSE